MGARTAMVALAALAAAGALHPRSSPSPAPASWTPPAQALEGLSLGHSTLAATVLWASTVTRWSAEEPPSPQHAVAVHSAVLTIGELDPAWVGPWFYGSLMCAHVGRHDLAADLRSRATRRFEGTASFWSEAS